MPAGLQEVVKAFGESSLSKEKASEPIFKGHAMEYVQLLAKQHALERLEDLIKVGRHMHKRWGLF